MLDFPLELFDRKRQALLGAQLTNVVPRRLNVGHSARIHCLNVVDDEPSPSLAIDGVPEHEFDWHVVQHSLSNVHRLLNKLRPQTLDFKLLQTLEPVFVD